MQRFRCFLLTGLFAINVCQAQFSAVGGANGTPYVVNPPVSSGLDKVYVFNGGDHAQLSYKTNNPSDWKWYRFEQNASQAVALPETEVQVLSGETVLNSVALNGGYMLVSSTGSKHYAYVVGYSPVNYREIRFSADGDVCNSLTLAVFADAEDMVYYSVNGIRTKLNRQHELSWNSLEWNSSSKVYETKERTSTATDLTLWSVDAPLTDTYLTVSGDQYAKSFGRGTSFKSGLYKAVAVKTNAKAEVQSRVAENELDKNSASDDLSGSAPLNVNFFSNPTPAAEYKEWYIYDTPQVSGSYKRRTDQDISYAFEQSGSFLVKLFVSNATCKDSASFTTNVLVSFIDCPNFFTPRSSPGENDEFRVAYKSIVSFKGKIVNRWGNVLFEWSDPALGWNGTFQGKPVSPGVYFYLIEAKGSDGVVYKKKGDINLLE